MFEMIESRAVRIGSILPAYFHRGSPAARLHVDGPVPRNAQSVVWVVAVLEEDADGIS